MKTIFISSTYSDLIPHRKEIWDLLNSFNVKITGMEQFGARKDCSLVTCLKEVFKSDIYIGIIGVRYGSIDIATGKSYTQLEYEKAIELKKEILIYLIDEEKSTVNPKNIDFENYSKLQEFKKILIQNHTIDKLTDENNLAKKLKKRLKEILQEKDVRSEYRPVRIPSKVSRFKIKNIDWLVFVGYRFGEPYEIHTIKANDYFLPASIKEGFILYWRNELGEERYDFQFLDNNGFE